MVRGAEWGGDSREDAVSVLRAKASSLVAFGWYVGFEKENTIVYKSRATISISKPSSRRQTVGPVYPQLSSSVIQTSRRARGVSSLGAIRARSSHSSYFVLRGGVDGRAPIIEPKPPMSFRSAGFRIWKLHIKFSSTVIIAPALSNSPQ